MSGTPSAASHLAEAKPLTFVDHVTNIYHLVIKELRSIRADPTMLILVAYAFSISVNTVATGAVTEATNLSVGIVDEDDVGVAVHNHPRWGTIWADLQRIPPVYDQTSAQVAGDPALYGDYQGAVNSVENAREAVAALGDARMALIHRAQDGGGQRRDGHRHPQAEDHRGRQHPREEVARRVGDGRARRLGAHERSGRAEVDEQHIGPVEAQEQLLSMACCRRP